MNRRKLQATRHKLQERKKEQKTRKFQETGNKKRSLDSAGVKKGKESFN